MVTNQMIPFRGLKGILGCLGFHRQEIRKNAFRVGRGGGAVRQESMEIQINSAEACQGTAITSQRIKKKSKWDDSPQKTIYSSKARVSKMRRQQ